MEEERESEDSTSSFEHTPTPMDNVAKRGGLVRQQTEENCHDYLTERLFSDTAIDNLETFMNQLKEMKDKYEESFTNIMTDYKNYYEILKFSLSSLDKTVNNEKQFENAPAPIKVTESGITIYLSDSAHLKAFVSIVLRFLDNIIFFNL
jgi:DNA repair ATPase RecN